MIEVFAAIAFVVFGVAGYWLGVSDERIKQQEERTHRRLSRLIDGVRSKIGRGPSASKAKRASTTRRSESEMIALVLWVFVGLSCAALVAGVIMGYRDSRQPPRAAGLHSRRVS